MKSLKLLTILGIAAMLASPALAASKRAAPANPEFGTARAQSGFDMRIRGAYGAVDAYPGRDAYPGSSDYVGTDPDPNIRFELNRDPPAVRAGG
jgi:hypothetical protein